MATHARDTLEVSYDEFCGALAAKDLQPLWTQAAKLMPREPIPRTLPWLWKWTTVLPLAQRAGELITIERGGERRVLALANPGLGGLPYTSSTLWGAYQYLGAHESAPAHRHTPSALRFVVEGTGVWTTVNGDMVWFDGLDLPLAAALEAVFFEPYPELMQPSGADHNASARTHGRPAIRPLGEPPSPRHSPLLVYRYRDTDAALDDLLRTRGGPMASIEFVNPSNGASAMPTLGCEMHRLVAGRRTPARRRVGSAVYVVFSGAGSSVIAGERFDWERGDVFVVPSWAPVEHEAVEPADLFAVTDRPVLEALHLYREEALDGPQPVLRTFAPK
ncbi:MAG: gentisate 1,2-dioxygenase [Chloroflexi bacterium]|nr:MAG: gentisate 1,2-dioxygenase [Chloroflexota bacterium]